MAKRIMIIDDETDVRLYLKTFFEKNGYETSTAKDGDEGFINTKAFSPDLITLDILMPKQSGIRLYAKFKEDDQLKDVPIVVLTGCLGGAAGPEFCRLIGIKKVHAMGIAVGTSSHGIGTARMVDEDITGGAFSGLSIGLSSSDWKSRNDAKRLS